MDNKILSSKNEEIITNIGKRASDIINASKKCTIGAKDEDYLEIGNSVVELVDLLYSLNKLQDDTVKMITFGIDGKLGTKFYYKGKQYTIVDQVNLRKDGILPALNNEQIANGFIYVPSCIIRNSYWLCLECNESEEIDGRL